MVTLAGLSPCSKSKAFLQEAAYLQLPITINSLILRNLKCPDITKCANISADKDIHQAICKCNRTQNNYQPAYTPRSQMSQMSRLARKPTLWAVRKVSTRISLSMPRRLTRTDTFRLLRIFCFMNRYSIPLSPRDGMCRTGLGCADSTGSSRSIHYAEVTMLVFSRDGSSVNISAGEDINQAICKCNRTQNNYQIAYTPQSQMSRLHKSLIQCVRIRDFIVKQTLLEYVFSFEHEL